MEETITPNWYFDASWIFWLKESALSFLGGADLEWLHVLSPCCYQNGIQQLPQICNLTKTCVVYPSNVDVVHSGEDTLNVKIVANFFSYFRKKEVLTV